MSESEAERTLTARGTTDARGALRVRRLCVVGGPSQGAFVLLDGVDVPLGRAGHVDGPLALADGEVSKHHATVTCERASGAYRIRDQASRNGTFLDGKRCAEAPLLDGSVIRVGSSVLVYEDTELPVFAPLEPETPTLPGPSLGMQRVRGEITLVAPQTIPVLLLGESGVGKELVAEEIHRQSGRAGPFVPVNCAAIASALAESEIFGHAAGAFTGAIKRNEGLFASAHEGTLFLDEIGELPLDLQPKLLRALARGEVRPVGSVQTARANVRLVAATNRDLAAAAATGAFRGDLFARVAGWTLTIPPLRARKHDIASLAARFASAGGSSELGPDVLEALLLHFYPYNVRELEQIIAAARVRAGEGAIRREHLPLPITARLEDRLFAGAAPAGAPLELLVPRDRVPTREQLCRVLDHVGGNMAEAAEYFHKDRRQVYRWAEKLGIDLDGFRKR